MTTPCVRTSFVRTSGAACGSELKSPPRSLVPIAGLEFGSPRQCNALRCDYDAITMQWRSGESIWCDDRRRAEWRVESGGSWVGGLVVTDCGRGWVAICSCVCTAAVPPRQPLTNVSRAAGRGRGAGGTRYCRQRHRRADRHRRATLMPAHAHATRAQAAKHGRGATTRERGGPRTANESPTAGPATPTFTPKSGTSSRAKPDDFHFQTDHRIQYRPASKKIHLGRQSSPSP